MQLVDFIAIVFMGFASFYLIGQHLHKTPVLYLAIMSAGYIFCLSLHQVYRHRIADSSLEMLKGTIISTGICTAVYVLFFGYTKGFASYYVRWILVYSVLSFCAVNGTRFFYRIGFELKGKDDDTLPCAVIYGAGDMGSSMARMALKGHFGYKIIGFIDDDRNLHSELVLGYPVFGSLEDLYSVFKNHKVDNLIIAITNISSEKVQNAVSVASKFGVQTKIVPSLFEKKGRADVSIRDIDYADLLGRQLNTIEKEPLFEMFSGKTILVTGAGGSIGSEICKQLIEYGLEKLIVLDIDETELHDLCLRLLNYEKEWSDRIIPVVCDMRNSEKMMKVFNDYKPDIVFHAAAYKHVPLMELYPEEAIINNICGSFNVFSCAKAVSTRKVVVISTDKAVNPTNVMGATKRVVEMMAAAFNEESESTDFCCVRFGNVIGSRGSMLPLFLEEIRAGRPITVTDRNIIRYFMAIPEAVSLVFRAATLANGGEVMVLDMGEPVKIYDFAQKLIDVFGDGRSTIKITGLRPGEKLYEELLANKDNTIPTVNEKIFKAKVSNAADFSVKELDTLVKDLPFRSPAKLLEVLHLLVPEFRSPEEKSDSSVNKAEIGGGRLKATL